MKPARRRFRRSPFPRCKCSQNTRGHNGVAQPPILEVRKLRPSAPKDLIQSLQRAWPQAWLCQCTCRYIHTHRSLQE